MAYCSDLGNKIHFLEHIVFLFDEYHNLDKMFLHIAHEQIKIF